MSELPPTFRIVRGSDIQRDGMYLELVDCVSGDEVAEVFYSDESSKMKITLFRQDVPVEVVEHLIEKAKRDLPPVPSDPKASL
jgi:hypothetical protein